MIKVPFCYKILGLCVNEDNTKDYGYIIIMMECKNKINREVYNDLHTSCFELEKLKNAEPISIEEYIENVDCNDDELAILKNDFMED